jgi:nicotinamide-nucleotide amidase
LYGCGFDVSYISFVGDNVSDIAGAFKNSVKRADIVISTGGLGPTSDDITAESAAKAFGLELVLDEKVLENIKELFRRRNRFMSDSNLKQAYIPKGAEALDNPNGTAPGIHVEYKGSHIYIMPGVPVEVKTIFRESILPKIKESFNASHMKTASVNATGITESEIFDRLKDIPGAKDCLRYYPSPEGIEIKIVTEENSEYDSLKIREQIKNLLGEFIYSTEGEKLEEVLGRMLKEHKMKIAVAESCTGGLISHRITNIPGSSEYFLCGVTVYSNESKQKILGVDKELIIKHGAVSAKVADAMAEGVRKLSGADIGVSTTGIAGPGGGSLQKPVGLMYAGISTAGGIETKRLQFVEDRIINKIRMSQAVLDLIRYYLKRNKEL